jgi:hypothetical protein
MDISSCAMFQLSNGQKLRQAGKKRNLKPPTVLVDSHHGSDAGFRGHYFELFVIGTVNLT